MSFKEKLKKSQLTISIFFATIVIVPLQAWILLPVTIQSFTALEKIPINYFPSSSITFPAYFLLTIIYCILASLFFRPKRIISPINIQAITVVVFSFLMIYNSFQISMTSQVFVNIFISLIFVAMTVILIGIVQLLIVRWVTGLNDDGTDKISYLVNEKLKDVLKNIGGKNYLSSRDFNILRDGGIIDNKILSLRCRDNVNNFVIVSFGSLLEDNNKTIIATVAYHSDLTWVSKSKKASIQRDSIINDIKERLEKNNNNIVFTKLETIDDLISRNAYSFIELITYSKITIIRGFFRRISRIFKFIIGITLFMFVSLTIAWYNAFIDNNTYIGIVATTVIALIIEIGITLKDEVSGKKTDWFED